MIKVSSLLLIYSPWPQVRSWYSGTVHHFESHLAQIVKNIVTEVPEWASTIKLMDVETILAELRHERDRIEEAILALERLARTGARRRGRPPKWLSQIKEPPSAASKRKGGGRKRSINAGVGSEDFS